MASTKRTIPIKSYLNIRDEKPAAAAITPGDLVERVSTGTVQKHGTASGIAEKLFALEDNLQGKKITDNYATADKVYLWKPTPGDRVYANIDPTSAITVAIGDFLVSAGDGSLTPLVVTSAGVAEFPNAIVAVAVEAAVGGDRAVVEIV